MHYRSSSVFSLGRWTSRFPTGLACPVVLRNSAGRQVTFAYRTGTVCGGLFNTLQLVSWTPSAAPTTPSRCSVWAVPRSLATTSGISVLISFPEGTEMFQFPSFATPGLCIQPKATWVYAHVGFPIRRSTGQRLYTAHRRFSQFYHVLLRLLVPRHPPNALTSLTTGNVASLAHAAC